DSFAFVAAGNAYVKSEAALRIARELPRWRWTWVFHFIPRPIRDAIYDLIARNRYRWFGRRDACMLPNSDRSWPSLPRPRWRDVWPSVGPVLKSPETAEEKFRARQRPSLWGVSGAGLSSARFTNSTASMAAPSWTRKLSIASFIGGGSAPHQSMARLI